MQTQPARVASSWPGCSAAAFLFLRTEAPVPRAAARYWPCPKPLCAQPGAELRAGGSGMCGAGSVLGTGRPGRQRSAVGVWVAC